MKLSSNIHQQLCNKSNKDTDTEEICKNRRSNSFMFLFSFLYHIWIFYFLARPLQTYEDLLSSSSIINIWRFPFILLLHSWRDLYRWWKPIFKWNIWIYNSHQRKVSESTDRILHSLSYHYWGLWQDSSWHMHSLSQYY